MPLMISYRIECSEMTLQRDGADSHMTEGERAGFFFSHQAVFTIPLYFANQEECVNMNMAEEES
jgi:hypothetical protein